MIAGAVEGNYFIVQEFRVLSYVDTEQENVVGDLPPPYSELFSAAFVSDSSAGLGSTGVFCSDRSFSILTM